MRILAAGADSNTRYYGEHILVHEWSHGTMRALEDVDPALYAATDGRTRLQSPDDLKAYDPKLFELLGRVYIGHHIPADVYHGRNIPQTSPPGAALAPPR